MLAVDIKFDLFAELAPCKDIHPVGFIKHLIQSNLIQNAARPYEAHIHSKLCYTDHCTKIVSHILPASSHVP